MSMISSYDEHSDSNFRQRVIDAARFMPAISAWPNSRADKRHAKSVHRPDEWIVLRQVRHHSKRNHIQSPSSYLSQNPVRFSDDSAGRVILVHGRFWRTGGASSWHFDGTRPACSPRPETRTQIWSKCYFSSSDRGEIAQLGDGTQFQYVNANYFASNLGGVEGCYIRKRISNVIRYAQIEQFEYKETNWNLNFEVAEWYLRRIRGIYWSPRVPGAAEIKHWDFHFANVICCEGDDLCNVT